MDNSISLWRGFLAIFRRDLLLGVRRGSESLNPLLFFLMATAMIPLGISPDPDLLSVLASGMLWVLALLATLLSLDRLFRTDYTDGSLEQLLSSPQPLYLIVLAKVSVHWILTGLPLALMSPLLGLMLSLPGAYDVMVISLLLGSATLSLIGAIGAALTVSLSKGGLLISLIIMPLYVPVLIFGSSAVTRTIEGFDVGPQLAILGALFALSLLLAPFAAATALRISVEG